MPQPDTKPTSNVAYVATKEHLHQGQVTLGLVISVEAGETIESVSKSDKVKRIRVNGKRVLADTIYVKIKRESGAEAKIHYHTLSFATDHKFGLVVVHGTGPRTTPETGGVANYEDPEAEEGGGENPA